MRFSEVCLRTPSFSSFSTAKQARARYHSGGPTFFLQLNPTAAQLLLTCGSHWLTTLPYLSSCSSPVSPHLSWLSPTLLSSPSAGAEGFPDLPSMSCLSHEEGSSLRCLLARGGKGRVCWKSVKLKFSRNNWSIVMIFYKASMEEE